MPSASVNQFLFTTKTREMGVWGTVYVIGNHLGFSIDSFVWPSRNAFALCAFPNPVRALLGPILNKDKKKSQEEQFC
jgi:hypothetical protein